MDLRLYKLDEDMFSSVINLCNKFHGKNYFTEESIADALDRSLGENYCSSYVMYNGPKISGKLVAVRITYLPKRWEIDEWCSPEDWGVPSDRVCYFKVATVEQGYQGLGIASELLSISIEAARKVGSLAGLSHIWLGNPEKQAFRYFYKNGGRLIAVWPNKWQLCATCVGKCTCSAAEMIKIFEEKNE